MAVFQTGVLSCFYSYLGFLLFRFLLFEILAILKDIPERINKTDDTLLSFMNLEIPMITNIIPAIRRKPHIFEFKDNYLLLLLV